MPNDSTAEKIDSLGKEIVSLGGEARLRALLRFMEVRMEEPDYKVRCRSAGPWSLSCPRYRIPSGKYTTKRMQLPGRVLCSHCSGDGGALSMSAPQGPSRLPAFSLAPATPNKQSP